MDDDADRRTRAFAELRQVFSAVARLSPLILVIDDLQWADIESLDLLAYLVQPQPIRGCAIVCSLRGYEDMDHEGSVRLKSIASAFATVSLGRLSAHDAERLLQAILQERHHGDEQEGTAIRRDEWLDRLIKEANGHPMFLSELAYWIMSQPSVPRWSSLQLQSLFWHRVLQFSADEQELLWMTAVVGVPVPYRVLCELVELSGDNAQKALTALREAQLITVHRRRGERYVEPYHDRIRHALVSGPMGSLTPAAREGGEQDVQDEVVTVGHGRRGTSMAAIHLRIGRALLAHESFAAVENHIFVIAKHLNAGFSPDADDERREEMLALNLRAGRKARLATSYQRADEYLLRATDFLPDDGWSEQPVLTRALALERMEIDFHLGRYDSGEARFVELLAHTNDVLERVRLHTIRVRLEESSSRLQQAIEVGCQGLRLLGMRLPTRGHTARALAEYVRVSVHRRGRSAIELRELPRLSDRRIQVALELLMAMSPPAFLTDTNLLIIILLRIVRLSLLHGIADVSAYAFAAFGGVLSGAFGNHVQADAMGNLARQIEEENLDRAFSCKVQFLCGLYITSWVQPFERAMAQIRVAFDHGRRFGDNQYTLYAVNALVLVAVCKGDSLDALANHCRWSRHYTKSHNNANGRETEIIRRYIHALREGAEDPTSLSVEGASEEELFAGLSEAETPGSLFYYHFYKAQLGYLFADDALAIEHIAAARGRAQAIFGMPLTMDHAMYKGLIAARCWDKDRKRRWRRVMRRALSRLHRSATSCSANYEARYWLLSAEYARICGQRSVAIARYGLAYVTAQSHGAYQHQAMAMELLARLLASSPEPSSSTGDLPIDEHRPLPATAEEAIALAVADYRRWGATAKAEHLATFLSSQRSTREEDE